MDRNRYFFIGSVFNFSIKSKINDHVQGDKFCVFVYMLMTDASLKQRISSIIRIPIFEAFSGGKKCALYTGKHSMRFCLAALWAAEAPLTNKTTFLSDTSITHLLLLTINVCHYGYLEKVTTAILCLPQVPNHLLKEIISSYHEHYLGHLRGMAYPSRPGFRGMLEMVLRQERH